jgi:hypothetical protein
MLKPPLISVCHRCRQARKLDGCAGSCPCPIDNCDISEHAQERYCPLGKYRLGPGDVIAFVSHKTGLWRLWHWWNRITDEHCSDCKGRQLELNHWWERLIRRWFLRKAKSLDDRQSGVEAASIDN